MNNKNVEIATFGGGCFWCLDAIFRITQGVTKVSSGYAGGEEVNPDYRSVHYNDSGHAEAVQIEFLPEIISYEIILQIFWTSHNPTTLNRDGANFGEEYRSVIFYHSDKQMEIAQNSMVNVASRIWSDPIVTTIDPYIGFYIGEEIHQNYYNNYRNTGYCKIIIDPKIAKFRKNFSDYIIDGK